MSKTNQLFQLAQKIASERCGFFEIKGPSKGDHDTNAFMAELRKRAKKVFQENFSEQRICGDNGLAVDFYFPEEETIVEIALSIRNPQSEFEHDLFKSLLAKEQGYKVTHLVFVTKPRASDHHKQPSSQAIISWVEQKHGIDVDIRELTRTLSH